MRQWMCDPRIMCRQHLLGEHVEHHMFMGSIVKGLDMSGYLKLNLLEPASLFKRHDELVDEMGKRGYNHRSPLLCPPYTAVVPERVYLGTDRVWSVKVKVDRAASLAELLRRVPNVEPGPRRWASPNSKRVAQGPRPVPPASFGAREG